MKRLYSLIATGGLLGSGLAQAHGAHAEVPYDSLLHLLAHNWPLLLVAATVIGGYLTLRRKRR